MADSRRSITRQATFFTLCAVALLSAGCSDSSDAPPAQGGAGSQAAGQGGSSAGAGTAGAAGGSSGVAGAAGAAMPPGMTTPSGTGRADQTAALALITSMCSDDLSNFYADATPPSPFTDDNRGGIVRCAYEKFYTAAQLAATPSEGSPASILASLVGVHKLRVAYWTERLAYLDPTTFAQPAGAQPVLTTGVLYLPEKVVQDSTGLTPPSVVAHGSVGEADMCAPSMSDPDEHPMLFAGFGWVVIQPDYPGLGTSGAPAQLDTIDEGHSVLDGTRALRKLFNPGFLSTHSGISGHSQGGHAAISAQALASTYGAAGTIDVVNAFAPVWFSEASWGAVLSTLAASMGDVSSFTLGSSAQYLYGHLAAHLGEPHRTDAFLPAPAAAAQNVLESQCFGDLVDPAGMFATAFPTAASLNIDEYTSGVSLCGAIGSCSDTTSSAWVSLWTEDRPAVDQTIPLSLWGGANDTTIPPDRQQCGINRMTDQTDAGAPIPVPLIACGGATADHSGILAIGAPWVRQFFALSLLGEPAPTLPCPAYDTTVTVIDPTSDAARAPKCPSLPPHKPDVTTP